jgi:hypothetical protein
MRFGRLTRGPRRVIVLFLTVTILPAAALAGSVGGPDAVFVEGEALEHQQQDHAGAVAAFRQLLASTEPAIRDGSRRLLHRTRGGARIRISTHRSVRAISRAVRSRL